MNNILTTLSFSIQSNKGVYALLLGSGVSRNSGIPTSWDIVTDLIRKLSNSIGEDCGKEPYKWFLSKYGKEPSYSRILSKLVKTPTERVNLLKSYFENTDNEDVVALKQPSHAHKAIAKLVKGGYIKAVITTNFDRLLEKALQDEGIEPATIRHTDDISGVQPLVHAPFTLIKVNGDYLDTRFLNTEEELGEYPDKMKTYILEIINNFGLITCGWSGEWDIGLVNTIKQSENYRYFGYFTYVRKCEQNLRELAISRKGECIEIESADAFFVELNERIDALETFNSNHPLNKDIAIARLKKYIARSDGIIQYNDLIVAEQEMAYSKILLDDYNFVLDKEMFEHQINIHKNALEILLPLCINAVQWAKPEHEQSIVDMISRFSQSPIHVGKGSYHADAMRTYYLSVLFLVYSIGIASVKFGKFSLLNKMFKLMIPEIGGVNNRFISLIKGINPNLFGNDKLNLLLQKNYHTHQSTLVHETINQYFEPIIKNESELNSIFDIFEYLLSLNYLNIVSQSSGSSYVPYGEFKWRRPYEDNFENNFFTIFFKSAEFDKDNWKPIKDGMFDCSYETYIVTKKKADEYLSNIYLH